MFYEGEPPKELGENRNWNVDLCPKIVISNGNMVKILVKTKTSDYINWRPIDGSYVYNIQ